MEALKPCPFCGGKAEHDLIETFSTDSSYYVIKCVDCGAKVDADDELTPEAIAVWNKRI